jgi:hypothetical protein
VAANSAALSVATEGARDLAATATASADGASATTAWRTCSRALVRGAPTPPALFADSVPGTAFGAGSISGVAARSFTANL